MEAKQITYFDLLNGSKQYVVPNYQRLYSWDKSHCEKLFVDLSALADFPAGRHFIGSVVFVSHQAAPMGVARYVLIDGQQRLTTLSLLVLALSRSQHAEDVVGYSTAKLVNQFIVNSDEPIGSDHHFKVRLTQRDAKIYAKLAEEGIGSLSKTELDTRIARNFQYFSYRFQDSETVRKIWSALARIDIVYVALEPGKDDPQAIFESLNSTGKDLSQTDLIRNFLLMDLETSQQDYAYSTHWYGIESRFSDRPEGDFDEFTRAFITTKTLRYPLKSESYETFKIYAKRRREESGDPLTVLQELGTFARYFSYVVDEYDGNAVLEQKLNNVRILRSRTVVPLFMQCFELYECGRLSMSDFIAIVDVFESYLVRRILVSLSNNSLDKSIGLVLQGIDASSEDFKVAFERHILQLKTKARFPRDSEVLTKVAALELYTNTSKNFILGRIENSYHSKEPIAVDKFSVEHIMPQTLTPDWVEHLGPDADPIHSKLLHTMGNLTLTGYNSELGNKPFEEKQKVLATGSSVSPLALTQQVLCEKSWTETVMENRTKQLAERALNYVWKVPSLLAEGNFNETNLEVNGFTVTVADLVNAGLLEPGTVLVWHRKQHAVTYYAEITEEGKILAEGIEYDNPSSVIGGLTGHKNINGWSNWCLNAIGGPKLEDVRGLYSQNAS